MTLVYLVLLKVTALDHKIASTCTRKLKYIVNIQQTLIVADVLLSTLVKCYPATLSRIPVAGTPYLPLSILVLFVKTLLLTLVQIMLVILATTVQVLVLSTLSGASARSILLIIIVDYVTYHQVLFHLLELHSPAVHTTVHLYSLAH